MPTLLNVIFPVLLALTTPTPTPAPTAPTATSTAATNSCYCQTIPMKDWGK
jgi:hypothetical protein